MKNNLHRSTQLTPTKARLMLHEGSIKGHPITDRQRRFFGAVVSSGVSHERKQRLTGMLSKRG